MPDDPARRPGLARIGGAGGSTGYDWLCHHANGRPDAPAVASWAAEQAAAAWLTYRELHAAAEETLAGLRVNGVQPGDRVMLVLPNAPCFLSTFLGCIGAGAIAVPGPVPTVARQDAFQERVERIVDDCRPTWLATDARWAAQLEQVLAGRAPGCRIISWQALRAAGGQHGPPCGRRTEVPAGSSDIALLQYTSGSTAAPRGIVITHGMLAASCAQAARAYAERTDDVAVTWVPLYHDMGLVTGVMRPLFRGYASVVLTPDDFSRDPACWLEAIQHCRGTVSSAPNFSYELCVRKVRPEQVPALDLSTWRLARNAGEVVRPDTAERFTRHFAPAGFPAGSLCPSYGLAEATLVVTTCGPGVPPARVTVRRSEIDRGRLSPVEARGGDPDDVRELLSSGVPVAGTRVRAGGCGRVGEIAISGPQLSPGRWRADGVPDRDTDRWYPTGDVGFVHDGHLFVLGRTDDTIVYQGRNIYMSDVLAACAPIGGLRPGRLAAFVVPGDTSRLDAVHAVAEVRSGTDASPATLAGLTRQVKNSLAGALGLYIASVRYVPSGALPVTTSGKVRVSEVRRRFGDGGLPLYPDRGNRSVVLDTEPP